MFTTGRQVFMLNVNHMLIDYTNTHRDEHSEYIMIVKVFILMDVNFASGINNLILFLPNTSMCIKHYTRYFPMFSEKKIHKQNHSGGTQCLIHSPFLVCQNTKLGTHQYF